MESGKIIFFLLLVFIAIMFAIGYDEACESYIVKIESSFGSSL